MQCSCQALTLRYFLDGLSLGALIKDSLTTPGHSHTDQFSSIVPLNKLIGLALTVDVLPADPIEMGAAAAVLAPAGRTHPLMLSAAKSSLGHAEPAAGLIGLLHLTASMQQAHSAPLLHLRTLNPLVAGILSQHPLRLPAAHSASPPVGAALQVAGQGAMMMAPRGPSALIAHSSGLGMGLDTGCTAGGVSAFAFQGTNAHVIVTSSMLAARRHNAR